MILHSNLIITVGGYKCKLESAAVFGSNGQGRGSQLRRDRGSADPNRGHRIIFG